MANRPTVDYQSATDLLLFRLQYALAKYEDLHNSLEALSHLLKMPLPLVKISAGHLEDSFFCKIRKEKTIASQLLSSTLTTDEEEILEITAAGVDEVQSWPPEKYREVAQRSDLTITDWQFDDDSDALTDPSGSPFILGVSPLGGDPTEAKENDDGDGDIPVITVPASDRTVTLDHNSPEYIDVVDTLQNLKQAIETNNEYRSSDIEDHERRLTDVETTLKILENQRVNENTMKAVAFGTLIYLAEKFAEHPIGELAKAAWDGLKSLLGIG